MTWRWTQRAALVVAISVGCGGATTESIDSARGDRDAGSGGTDASAAVDVGGADDVSARDVAVPRDTGKVEPDAPADTTSAREAAVDRPIAIDSGPDSAAGCPPTQPAQGSSCPTGTAGLSRYCTFGESICSCYYSRRFLPDGGMFTTEVWACGMAPPGCPKMVPVNGTPCDRPGQTCQYDLRGCAGLPTAMPSHTCEGGVWRVRFTACS